MNRCPPSLVRKLLLGFSMSFAGVAAAAEPRLVPLDAPAAALDAPLTWRATYETAARFAVDVPGPGLLSVVARSDDGDDIMVAVTDGFGVIHSQGAIDADPVSLPGGEFGAVLVPAGTAGVAVVSNEGTQDGTLLLSFSPLPDVPVAGAPAAWFENAPELILDQTVESHVMNVAEATATAGGETRRVFYFKAASTAPHTLSYTPDTDEELFLQVYPATSMWEPIFDYDQSGGAIRFVPAAGTGYFVVIDSFAYDQSVEFTLTLESLASRSRRAPR